MFAYSAVQRIRGGNKQLQGLRAMPDHESATGCVSQHENSKSAPGLTNSAAHWCLHGPQFFFHSAILSMPVHPQASCPHS